MDDLQRARAARLADRITACQDAARAALVTALLANTEAREAAADLQELLRHPVDDEPSA